ncbi:MAG: hypothetical protein ACK5L8_08095 [Marinicella pacifica]
MYRILMLLIISFSAQAVIVNGSEEHSRLMLPQYVEGSELVVIGNVFSEHTNQFIKVDGVLKGNPRFKGEIIPTYSIIPYVTNLTCGTGQPLPIPDDDISIVFFDSEPNLPSQSNNNKPASHGRHYHLEKKI